MKYENFKYHKNLLQKYDITEEELESEINRLPLGKICDVRCLLAITDLLLNGDVEKEYY